MHATPRNESGIVLGALAVAGVAYGAAYLVKSLNTPAAENEEEPAGDQGASSANDGGGRTAKAEGKESEAKTDGQSSASNFFNAFGGQARFYEGGFLDKMTRREAAQILGIRESASASRIKEAHRRVLMANHPDRGGSPYVASKINEAKEMLLKGK